MGSHRGLMTIYFKNRCISVNMCLESWKTHKHLHNYGFFINCVPKYVIRWVILVYLSIIYVTNHNGITQRPHDHLFQKSGHLCNKCSKKLEKPRKIRIYFSWCTQIRYQLSNICQFVHHRSITSLWYHTETSWPFTSNVVASRSTCACKAGKHKNTWLWFLH